MTKRSSLNNFKDVYDLNDLESKVVDKRIDKRKPEKRKRRNRHYNKQFIKQVLSDLDDDALKEKCSSDSA